MTIIIISTTHTQKYSRETSHANYIQSCFIFVLTEVQEKYANVPYIANKV